ncbi:cytochrome P450 [Lactarius hatsudake]|nr:cytochrome P450 [Lactarius hatsudake]
MATLPCILPSLEKIGFIWKIPGIGGACRVHLLAATPIAGFILCLIVRVTRRAIRNLPPGPKGLPLIGDALHALDYDWLSSPQRKDEYDAGGFLTQNLTFSLTGYGDLWRRFRRPTVDGFSKTAVQHLHPIQSREAIMLALALTKYPPSPKQFQRHTWSSLLSINYDHPPVDSEDDPAISGVAEHILRIMHEVHSGMRLVEFFPWMKYIPNWFAKWKRDAQHWFVGDSLRNEHFLSEVADDLVNGIDRPCFGATLLKNQDKYPLSELERAWLLGDIVGTSLVSPLPFGIPHASSADDWYEGMYIPKGTIILPNMRLINSDPAVYGADSARFNPSRYMDDKGQVGVLMDGHEGHVSFGYGRRVCPGRFAAEGTLAIDFATLLWALHFDVLRVRRINWTCTPLSPYPVKINPTVICDVLNVANEGQPFGTRREIAKGSLSEPSYYEPEDKANEGCRKKGVGHAA